MKITQETLERMKAVDIESVSPEELTDLNSIVIDNRKSVADKLVQFQEQTNNLFINAVGEYVVKVSYADTDQTINDKMKHYISRLAEIDY